MYAIIFNDKGWNFKNYDGRRREFRGISRDEFNEAKRKNRDREIARFRAERSVKTKTQSFKEWIRYFSTIPYEYTGDGFDDFNHYQRPASNGIGYVDICPGERGNNNYVDEPHLVAALTRKYKEWKTKFPSAGRR